MSLAISKGDKILDVFFKYILIIIGILSLYPIYFVLIASFSEPVYIYSGEVFLWPKGFNIIAYIRLLDNPQIWIGYRNSIFYTLSGTMINLIVTIPCAYALSRKNLPFRKTLSFIFIFTMYFRGGIVPLYLLINSLGILNKPWALILPGAISAYNMIIARSFFESSIPEAIYESARIDGASTSRLFFQFAVPLSSSMISVIALFCALVHWNSYLNALMYIQDPNLQTLQVIIRNIAAKLDVVMGEVMDPNFFKIIMEKQIMRYAIVLVSIVPLLIAYPFIQRFFIRGIMIGAIKG